MLTHELLNDNQKKATNWGDGPILILAGPGSGKTAVLTLRIARLIQETPNHNFKVLGLTFTVKAANEMKKRLVELLGENSKRVELKTFHSFCSDLLRQHGSHLGLKPDFSVITDEKDRTLILKELNDSGRQPINDPEDYLKKIDIMFINGIRPEDLEKYYEPNQIEHCHKLQAVFNAYLEILLQSNQLDFGAMIFFANRLLSSKERILRQLHIVYKYICVDEFQDTNLAQYQILKHIACDKTSNLFVVADDDQVIFQWNGADPKRLEELKADYNPQIVQLPENYRCPSAIVKIANCLIKHNSERIKSKIENISYNATEGVIKVACFADLDSELAGLSEEIKKIAIGRRANCLVIARTNKILIQAKQLLVAQGAEAEVVNKSQNFSSPIFLFIYYILKLFSSTESRSVLNKLCSVASAINGITLSAEEIVAQANIEGTGLLRTFLKFASKSEVLQPVCSTAFTYLIDSYNYSEFVRLSANYFESRFVDIKNVSADYSSDKSNWDRISREIKDAHGDKVRLHIFLQELDLTPKEKPLPRTCVRLQTVHTAKGMEFEHVFVIGLAEDQFPTYFSIQNGEAAVEEERRSCFVAITRSSKTLYLSYADNYYGWSKKPSRFLYEMGVLR